MTQVTNNKMEPEPEEIWDAWQKWDDGFLYENGRARGINECIQILKDVAANPELSRMPSDFVVALVIATLQETQKENHGNV